MVAPTWEAAGALLESSTGTPAIAVPAGVEAGTIVTVSMFLDSTASVTGIPTGFAECEGSPLSIVAGSGSHSLVTFWKRATGSDSGTYDFTLSGSTFVHGYSERFGGCVASGNPWDLGADTAQELASTTDTPPVDITTLGPDRLVVWRATDWSVSTWTPPSGFDERVDTGFGLLTSATKTQAAAGATGNVVGTATAADKHNVWMAALKGEAPPVANKSVADQARENMLAALGQTEPQLKSNVDLMREVVAAGGLSLVTVTSATAAVHYWQYLEDLRD